MTHRERVMTALAHERPDRCPMQISCTPEFAARLRNELQFGESVRHNPHGGGNTYDLELELGVDMLLTSVCWADSYYANEVYSPGADRYRDEWGVEWLSVPYETRFGEGHYTEMVGHPLADERAISSYRAPDAGQTKRYNEARRVVREFGKDYWIVGVTVTTMFETAWALRGYEQFLVDLVLDPDLAEALLDIPYGFHLEAAKHLVESGVDMIWIGDDVGSQNAMLISPELWRRFLKPRMACFISELKALNPSLKVAYHSDGNILPIIPELIEIGLDVLNPIQPRCMDPDMLKQEFGDRLSFWGGIDIQHTLPFGSVHSVRQEVQSRMEKVGQGGGFIIGPTHHVQLDTPMENFFAMVETVRQA